MTTAQMAIQERYTFADPETGLPTVITPVDYNICDSGPGGQPVTWIHLVRGYPVWGALAKEYDTRARVPGATENVLVGRIQCDPDLIPGVETGEIEVREFDKPLAIPNKQDYFFTHVLVLRNLQPESDACKWVESLFAFAAHRMPFYDFACLLPQCAEVEWVANTRDLARPVRLREKGAQ